VAKQSVHVKYCSQERLDIQFELQDTPLFVRDVPLVETQGLKPGPK